MTTQTLTLTDFLLARLAEDEAAARASLADEQMNPNLRLPEGWVNGVATRVLAEVEAKRRIVEVHPWEEYDICLSNDAMGHLEPIDSCPVLRALASVYADHPEYRAEWAA